MFLSFYFVLKGCIQNMRRISRDRDIIGGQILIVQFTSPKHGHLIHTLRYFNHTLVWGKKELHTMNTNIFDVAINNVKGFNELLFTIIFITLITHNYRLYTFIILLTLLPIVLGPMCSYWETKITHMKRCILKYVIVTVTHLCTLIYEWIW